MAQGVDFEYETCYLCENSKAQCVPGKPMQTAVHGHWHRSCSSLPTCVEGPPHELEEGSEAYVCGKNGG
jgi:hypothetical protein